MYTKINKITILLLFYIFGRVDIRLAELVTNFGRLLNPWPSVNLAEMSVSLYILVLITGLACNSGLIYADVVMADMGVNILQ
jgi:hypothetical protein